jgi:IS30 family transposase
MAHKHIGQEDWPVIARMLKAGFFGSEIARTLGKDPSAVNRHIKQNGGRGDYDIREVRRQKHHKRIVAMNSIRVLKGVLLRTVIRLLKEHYSPEQIAGTLETKGKSIVASTIYRYIKERAPHLKKFLRSQKGKYRRRRGTKLESLLRNDELMNDRRWLIDAVVLVTLKVTPCSVVINELGL